MHAEYENSSMPVISRGKCCEEQWQLLHAMNISIAAAFVSAWDDQCYK